MTPPGVPQLIAVYHVNNFICNDKIIKDEKLLLLVLGCVQKASSTMKSNVTRFKCISNDNKLQLHDNIPLDVNCKFSFLS